MNPLYDFTVPPFINSLKNAISIMEKAEAYAKEKGDNVESYIELQIHPDMKNFAYQIQRASDAAKYVIVRVAGVAAESVAMPDDEKTWDDLKQRLRKTVKVLEEANPEDFKGKENIEVSLFGGKVTLTGKTYLTNFAIPNFNFHYTTFYDILRMKGVPIGKMDFLQEAK